MCRLSVSALFLLLTPTLSPASPSQDPTARAQSPSSDPQNSVQTRTANDGQVILEDIPDIPDELKQALLRYQNVRSASVAGWTQNGRSLYVKTRFGDVPQLHRVDTAGGARHQLTFLDEPIGQIACQPQGDLIAFLMDTGGDENTQIFIFDPHTGEHRMVSDGRARHGALVWNREGTHLAFQSTRRDGRSNDIWVMDIKDPSSARIALQSTDGSWWGPVEFSADGARLLALNYVSISDARVHQVDLQNGTHALVAGSVDHPSYNVPFKYDQSGQGIYLKSNQGTEFTQLIHLDLLKGTRRVLTSDLSWDVEEFTLTPARDRAAFTINEGGRGSLYFLDTQSQEKRKVEGVPIGLIESLDFSSAGQSLALTLNTARSPSDAFVLDLGKSPLEYGALTRWTHSEVGGLDTSTFIEPQLITYPTFDQIDGGARQIPAFVYPAPQEGPRPVAILIHGGPEGQFKPGFISLFQLWTQKLGMTVITPNVRGSSGYGATYVNLDNGFKREDSVRDIGALLEWIKTQPQLDASRVAVVGGSYGGYMVLASAVMYSDRLRAAVDIVGISNFVTFLKNTKDYRRDLRRVEYGDERVPEMAEFLERISPNNHVDRIRVPLFVVQGQNDPRVPVSEAVQIVKALRDAGRKTWYMNALNEGHGYRKKENRDLYTLVMTHFLKLHLLN